jgi:hypothetical protein
VTPGAARYVSADAVWESVACVPPITRAEAEAAAKKLYRVFGGKTGHDHQTRRAKLGRVRRCWITAQPGAGLRRGWRRLVHDVSHRIFQYRHPGWRPHHPQHAALEQELAVYVVTQTDWLSQSLACAPKSKPVRDLATVRRARVEARLAGWEAKLKRAQKAVAKLRRQVAYYERRKPVAEVSP